MSGIGRRTWVVPGGRVPFPSHGQEPEMTSHDELAVLNTGEATAELELTFYYEDRDPVGPYPLTVPGERVRQVRVNDLIRPEAVPLDTPYSCVVRSDVPVVVQLTRQDTRLPGALALLGVMGWADDT